MPHLSTAERIGRDIGRKEGRMEGRRQLLLDQISVKFGPSSEETIAIIHRLTDAELDRLGKAILTANTLDELGLVP